ncbi:MAG: acyl-CoA dehydrogenase family protein [Alphaproteobacteria bacterium]|nr:acyl-CoA dehydrogenase family protein [Alphaproteobacteria bacterium]
MPDATFLDWPFFEPSHRVLAEGLEDWARASLPALLKTAEEDLDGTCRRLVEALAAAGWLDYAVPASHGGRFERLDVRSLCLIREILARHSGLADFAFVMQGLGSGPISLMGSAAQKDAWLQKVRRGQAIAAFALSEPEAGSDVAALAATAEDHGDHWRIHGEKTWISNGGLADFHTLVVRTGSPEDGARGLSAFLCPADTPGLEVVERIEVIAPHPLARLRFNDLRLPKDALIGAVGAGFKLAMANLDIFRSTVGAAALGFARRALDETLGRAGTRHLFGAPMSELQMVQGKLADMALRVDAAALLVYRAAWTKDSGAERVTREASMAKLYATDEAQKVIDDAVQLFGGHGVVSGHPVETLYREIRALRIYEGASEVQKLIIARQAMADFAAGSTIDAAPSREGS